MGKKQGAVRALLPITCWPLPLFDGAKLRRFWFVDK